MGNWIIVTTNTTEAHDLMNAYANATLIHTGTNALVWWWEQAADADVATVQAADPTWSSVGAP